MVYNLVGTVRLTLNLVLVVTAEWNIPLIYGVPRKNLKLSITLDALLGFAVDFVDADFYRPLIVFHLVVVRAVGRKHNGLVAAQRTGR